jgi:hypothetical protein
MEKFREEMDGTGKQAIGNNQKELDNMWGQLMATVVISSSKTFKLYYLLMQLLRAR